MGGPQMSCFQTFPTAVLSPLSTLLLGTLDSTWHQEQVQCSV